MAVDQRSHPLVEFDLFCSIEEYVLNLIQRKGYEYAAEMARGRVVLDWGCNQGYGIEILRRKAVRVSGLDISPRAIEAATARLPELASEIRLYDGTSVPFDAGTFDMVTSFQVIEHVADHERYLSSIRSVLKPGGCALFTTPNASFRLDPGMKPWNKFHVREFTSQQLYDLLSDCFSTVEILTLRATPEIEFIERSRCELARVAARRSGIVKGLRRIGSAFLRKSGSLSRGKRTPLPSYVLSRFSLADFSYGSANLDSGLDFLAIAWK